MEQHIISKKRFGLDATTIKMIALVLMLFDHIHQMYASQGAPIWLKMMGRPVFPLFLFIAAESFHYTRNRKKYLQRLLLASLFMSLAMNLLSFILPNPNIVLMNNAFSTFFIAGLYMQFWDWLVQGIKEKNFSLIFKSMIGSMIPVLTTFPLFLTGYLMMNENIPISVIRGLALLSTFIPNIIGVEGGFLLVILGVLFYIFREKRLVQIAILLLLSAALYMRNPGNIQWLMCGAVIPMLLYNGERGRNLKNLFYIFYPAHIIVLYLIATIFDSAL